MSHLIVTRRQGERTFVGENIEVVIEEIRSESVRLGFYAPRDVSILREEAKLKRDAEADDETTK